MKLLAKVLLALVVVLLLLVGALHLWLGSLIKRGVEQVGPSITQTSVTLRDADISLLSGRAELEDLTVGNPKGFQTPSAFRLHNATVRLDWKSVLSDTVVIEEILIDGPEISFEGTPAGSNLGTIRDNAKAYAPAESSEKAPVPKRDAQQGSGKKVVIKQFTMTNARAIMLVRAGGVETKAQGISLQDIRLENIGDASGGASFHEVIATVLTSITNSASRLVTSLDKPLEKGAQMLGESSKQVGQSAEKATSKALENAKGLLNK
jgi:uncharacterized protein involved in outer membrane biogenesis